MRTLTPFLLSLAAIVSFAACARAPSQEMAPQAEAAAACVVMRAERMPVAERASPLDSLTFSLDGSPVKICYSRPSARDREVMGGLVPYGELWRTGANEPTMIHTPVPLQIAGIRVEPGSYSLYTVPGENEWQVVVNRSITQWGHPRSYSEEVRAQEIDRAAVPAGATDEFVEMFTIRSAPASNGATTVILEWERTRVEIPVRRAG